MCIRDSKRLATIAGDLDWDINSVCGARAGLLFALDLNYKPDLEERIFKFDPPRETEWTFELPAYLQ